MKKIISLFKRDYGGLRLVYDEIVPGAEWVVNGEGVATIKYDGTACMVKAGQLYKRYDRKLTKLARKRHFDRDGNRVTSGIIPESDYKPAPHAWVPCEEQPDEHTGHWPGWLPIGEGAEDRWHREVDLSDYSDGTYELVGPKIQGNPYHLSCHSLWLHGASTYIDGVNAPPRDFEGLRQWFEVQSYEDYDPKRMNWPVEGIVWHHPDGRMVKIKRRDFGLEWPLTTPG